MGGLVERGGETNGDKRRRGGERGNQERAVPQKRPLSGLHGGTRM